MNENSNLDVFVQTVGDDVDNDSLDGHRDTRKTLPIKSSYPAVEAMVTGDKASVERNHATEMDGTVSNGNEPNLSSSPSFQRAKMSLSQLKSAVQEVTEKVKAKHIRREEEIRRRVATPGSVSSRRVGTHKDKKAVSELSTTDANSGSDSGEELHHKGEKDSVVPSSRRYTNLKNSKHWSD